MLRFRQKKHSRSAQAAMDYLMIYGWAVLLVAGIIIVLAYFGVLSPEKFFPEECLIQPGVSCVSHKVTSSEITLVLRNNLGREVTVNSITAGDCSSVFDSVLEYETQQNFVLSGCKNGELRDRFSHEISIKYTESDTNLIRTAFGNLNTLIEE